MLCDPMGAGQGTGRWTVPQAAEPREPRGSVRALSLWWANGRLELLGPFPAGQMNRWPHKQKHTDSQAHTDTWTQGPHTQECPQSCPWRQTHAGVHMYTDTCVCTQAHSHMHTCNAHTQTHRGACFSGCLLPTPPTSYSFSSPHSPLPPNREGG